MSSSSSSEEEIVAAEAPMEIQMEIMKWLPVKSLLRFRQVSKQWKSIIQSSRFISDYYNHIQQQQPLNHLFVYDCVENHLNIFDDHIRFIHRITAPISADDDLKLHQFMGSSHGLFGFICRRCKDGGGGGFTAVIWNPSVRKSVCIPSPLNNNTNRGLPRFGFTVCNATDLTIFKIPHGHHCVEPLQVDIFRLSTGVWTTFSIDPPRGSILLTPIWKAIDRFIYWLAVVVGNHFRIFSFDLITQQFTQLCLPPCLTPRGFGFGLGLSRHKDSLVVRQVDVGKLELTVWMMEPDGGVQNSFKKLYTVKAPPYTVRFPDVIGFRENGQPIMTVRLSDNFEPTFIFYEPDLERFNDIQISGYGSKAGSYMASLLLLDH